MAYSILLTSLYTRSENEQVKYFYTKEGERIRYCDALLSGEASSKYILSQHHIDEIVIIGSQSTCDPGDENRPIVLREGTSFIAADMASLSSYSLLQYRLAQYIMELDIESRDVLAFFEADQQKKIISFLKRFFRKTVNKDGTKKFNRLFDALAQDPVLLGELGAQFAQEFPEAAQNPSAYLDWIRGYLYGEMKDTLKLESLTGNVDTKVRFIPTRTAEDGALPADNLLRLIDTVTHFGKAEVDLYLCLHGDNVSDTFVLLNVLDMLRGLPDSRVRVRAIFTTDNTPNMFVNLISDDTETFSITELLSGTQAFLDYGKVDRLLRYWTNLREDDPFIESMIYAMRSIDAGISLCDISDIEHGINRLRELFQNEETLRRDTYKSRLFSIVIDGVKRDYGPLLEGERPSFIELVKWGYRKKFFQQTLTIIESRAPEDMEERGIYFYARSEEDQEKALNVFAEAHSNLRPYEKYKVEEDLAHYFVKFYRRDKAPHNANQILRQKGFAEFRTVSIDTDEPDVVGGRTYCRNRDLVRDLLFAYYHVGDVRNLTNHASTRDDGSDSRLIIEESDMTVRMNLITQGIEYFILCHEKCCEDLEDGPRTVMRVDVRDIARKGNRIRKERDREWREKRDRNKEKDREKEQETGTQAQEPVTQEPEKQETGETVRQEEA